jgi:hypothetical protein
MHFGGIQGYGKKYAILGFAKRPQDVVAIAHHKHCAIEPS